MFARAKAALFLTEKMLARADENVSQGSSTLLKKKNTIND